MDEHNQAGVSTHDVGSNEHDHEMEVDPVAGQNVESTGTQVAQSTSNDPGRVRSDSPSSDSETDTEYEIREVLIVPILSLGSPHSTEDDDAARHRTFKGIITHKKKDIRRAEGPQQLMQIIRGIYYAMYFRSKECYMHHGDISPTTAKFYQKRSGEAVGVLFDVDDVVDYHLKARLLSDYPEHLLDPATRHRPREPSEHAILKAQLRRANGTTDSAE